MEGSQNLKKQTNKAKLCDKAVHYKELKVYHPPQPQSWFIIFF